MNDLISRKAAIEAIEELTNRYFVRKAVLVIAQDTINNLPSAQPEIIRCKDCKWYVIYQLKKDGTDDRRYKPSYCLSLSFHPNPKWFCADGERKEDETD